MPPVAIPSVYCTPSDLFDYYGTEGGELRVDDHNLATGQTILTRTDSPPSSTTMAVTALAYPLLGGTVLHFDGAGMPAVVEVTLTATVPVGATSLTVSALAADVPAGAEAFDSGVNVALAQRLWKACQFGTGRVRDYCLMRYNDSDLYANAQQNGSVKRWATALAAQWLGRRRGQVPPAGVEDDAKESLEELKQVRTSMICIGGVPTRTNPWPFISNVTVDPRFDTVKLRVEQTLSELTPTQFGQYVDWNSITFLEW